MISLERELEIVKTMHLKNRLLFKYSRIPVWQYKYVAIQLNRKAIKLLGKIQYEKLMSGAMERFHPPEPSWGFKGLASRLNEKPIRFSRVVL